jgi:hypothetical protein
MKIGVNLSTAAAVLLLPHTALTQSPSAPNSGAPRSAIGVATPPAQAVSAGFTTTLVNQDCSLGILDLGCDGKSQKHFWNQGMEWEKPPAPCIQISIVTDPVAGQQVLNLEWLPSQTDPFDATIVSTLAHDYSQYYTYGHAYYEAIFRATPKNIGGIWPGFWMAGVNAVIFHALPPYGYAPSSELDVVELRGEKPTFVSSNIHENGKGYGQAFAGWINDFDYTQYHKYGYLWTHGGNVCMYLDDVKMGCATVDASTEYERNYILLSLQFGCQWQAGNRSCINLPITGVTENGSGQVRLTVGSTAGFQTWDAATISGVNGIPSANGSYVLTVVDGTHLDLMGSKFSGAYTAGGTINALSEANMYVKSVRVWSCADDAANAC